MKRLFDLGVDYSGLEGRSPAAERKPAVVAEKSSYSDEQKNLMDKRKQEAMTLIDFFRENPPVSLLKDDIFEGQKLRFEDVQKLIGADKDKEALRSSIENLEQAPMQRNYKPAVAFLDSLQGTNVAQGLKDVETPAERAKAIADLNRLASGQSIGQMNDFTSFARAMQIEPNLASLLPAAITPPVGAPSDRVRSGSSVGKPKPGVFETRKQTKEADKFIELQDKAGDLDRNLSTMQGLLVNPALDKTGQGPGGIYSAGKSVVGLDPELQDIDLNFKGLNVDTLVEKFAGFAKAIDSNVERQSFERSRPNIKNKPEVNRAALLNNISVAMKLQYEAEQQKEYYESNPNRNLEGYRSTTKNMDTYIDPSTMQMVLAPKGKPPEGYVDREKFIRQLVGRNQGPSEGQMERNKKTGETRVFKNGKWEKVQ